jgi:dolichol-phosphate mannosyltransferase
MRFVILIPTYNESDSIVELLERLSTLHNTYAFDVIVIDDNSPDKTGDIVDNLNLSWVSVLRRVKKDGLGNAYRAAIREILNLDKYSHIISMDADGSHQVADLEKLITEAGENPGSVILGTRWMTGGSVVNWPRYRQFLSRSGTRYAQRVLRIPLRDLTGGFRIYPVALIKQLNIDNLVANGYCYQIEMVIALNYLDTQFIEVPITFIERENGKSKMSRAIVIEALWQTTIWGVKHAVRPNADKLHYVK